MVYSPEQEPTSAAEALEDFTAPPTDILEDSPASPEENLEDEPVSPPPVAKDAKYTASPAKQKVWQRLLALSKGREKNSSQDDSLIR